MPTKAMIRSAEVAHLVARRAAEFGVEIEGKVHFNLARAVARKDGIVNGIVDSIHGALEPRHDVIRFVRGQARFLSTHEVETGEGRLSFDKAIIATGARNVRPHCLAWAGELFLALSNAYVVAGAGLEPATYGL